MAETTSTDAAPAPIHKLFVGNLAFATTQDSLREAFTVVGQVVSADVVMRGMFWQRFFRGLGLGFFAPVKHF